MRDEITNCWRKKRVVSSSGPHINWLHAALEAQVPEAQVPEALPQAAPAPVEEEFEADAVDCVPDW